MLRRNTTHRQAAGSYYSSDEIAKMPLAQLRELSDLQLSERELADVIAAIHSGGPQILENQTTHVHPDAEVHQCPLCQPDEHFSSAQCFVCDSDAPTDSVQKQGQLIAQWVSWYREYKVWASACQQAQAHAEAQLS